MKNIRLDFFYVLRTYWVELFFVPPILTTNLWLLYGDFYLSSWGHFFMVTIPWLCSSILIPVLCHRVRNATLQRFPGLNQWFKRVVFSVIGYGLSIVPVATLTYVGLSYLPYPEMAFSWPKWYALLFLCKMSVWIGTAAYEGITYFQKWKAAQTEAETLEKLQLESQFQSLQSQLNPHFLFNSLNVLSSLISENPRKAEDFVDELSNVYRYLLRANELERTRVKDELRFIRSYAHLLETRHDTGIQLKTNVAPEFSEQILPTLSLQILVENAVKHNEISPEKPLSIEIGANATGLWITNNIQHKNARPLSNRVGLDNLRDRYQLLNQNGFEVQNDGHFFTVILPFINS